MEPAGIALDLSAPLPHTPPMTLHCSWRDMMREAAQRLGAAGVENPRRDARLLLAHALGIAPVDVIGRESDAIDPVALTDYQRLVQRRLAGEPVSRIRGFREFYGRNFRVTPDVLDPRPETELLVSEGLKRLPGVGRGEPNRVLDLGTGSGCILVSVLAERPDLLGVGVDISPAALEVAKENAAAQGVADRATFIEGSWGAASGLFDLILSNPPYVAACEIDTLARDVRAFDPHIALTDGGDGLSAYRAILSHARLLLKPGASIGFEFGLGQVEAVGLLMANAGLTSIATLDDLAGIPRAAFARSEEPRPQRGKPV